MLKKDLCPGGPENLWTLFGTNRCCGGGGAGGGAGGGGGGTQMMKNMCRNNEKAARSMGTLLLVFFICWSPIAVCVSLSQTFHIYKLPPVLFDVGICLLYLNSTMNPLLYAAASKRFRQNYRTIVCFLFPDKTS